MQQSQRLTDGAICTNDKLAHETSHPRNTGYQLSQRSSGLPALAPPLALNCIALGRVRCSEIHGPGVVLVGDAAHAVTPIGGQGCNAALEDSLVLSQVLSDSGAVLL